MVCGGVYHLSVSFAGARTGIFKTSIGAAWFTKTHPVAKVARSQSGSRMLEQQAILDRHACIANVGRRYRSMNCFSRVLWASVGLSGPGLMAAEMRTAATTCFVC